MDGDNYPPDHHKVWAWYWVRLEINQLPRWRCSLACLALGVGSGWTYLLGVCGVSVCVPTYIHTYIHHTSIVYHLFRVWWYTSLAGLRASTIESDGDTDSIWTLVLSKIKPGREYLYDLYISRLLVLEKLAMWGVDLEWDVVWG